MSESMQRLEKRLIEAGTREDAENLVKHLKVSELAKVANFLSCVPVKKNKREYIESIVNCTYEAVRRSQIIRKMRTE